MSGIHQAVFQNQRSFGPRIGQAFGGGFNAGIIVQGGVQYYVIAAPRASGESSGTLLYKNSETAGPAETRTLNNGPAASASINNSSHQAAQFCEGLSIGGFTDWYMPSRDELQLCYFNLKPTTAANSTSARSLSGYTYSEGNDVSGDTMGRNRNSNPLGNAYTSGNPAQTSVAAFQAPSGAEQFRTDNRYWSCSEFSATQAWDTEFSNGNQTNFSKWFGFYVRAVRRVPV